MKATSKWVIFGMLVTSLLYGTAPDIKPSPVADQPTADMDLLIRQLKDENFGVREKATRQLWRLGETALPALEQAAKSSDPEQLSRARDLLRKIQMQITPDTDPSVITIVENYLKASLTEKTALLEKLKVKHAWRQMLNLYASEKQAATRKKLSPSMNGIAVYAARERILQGDAKGAREFLEMAPADSSGLLALAEFHRSHGTLDAELAKVKAADGDKTAAWRLALNRAAGNIQAAQQAALIADEPRVGAAMAALAGDPLPWLREVKKNSDDEDTITTAYSRIAAKRWLGQEIDASDLSPLTKKISAHHGQQSEAAIHALFLLGKPEIASPAFVKNEPLSAFIHYQALELIPEAYTAIGLDPEHPDYASWIKKRLASILNQDIGDQHEVATGPEEIIMLANFLEHKGLHQEAFDAFATPFAELARKNESKFIDFLRSFFGDPETANGAPGLARKIGGIWAGEDGQRWNDLFTAAFGNDDAAKVWWDWLVELKPKASHAERFDAMLALFRIGSTNSKLREQWLSLAWKAVEAAPADRKTALIERISDLANQTGDVANSLKAWNQLPEESRKAIFWGQRLIQLSAVERWDDAANTVIQQMDLLQEAKQTPNADMHAYAASALRQAGREDEARIHDAWADKLALGNVSLAIRIGNGYSYGNDYQRAAMWWARAASEADPDSEEFAVAIKLLSDHLLEDGRWKEAASLLEVLARIYATSDYRSGSPLPLLRQRVQADTAHALDNLNQQRQKSIALLEQCHHNLASDGSLADCFFPALRKAGLIEEHDRWFHETWSIMEKVIQKYPASDNTRNTAAWFAARALLNLDTAQKLLTPVIDKNPTQSAYLDTMAEIQFAMGNRSKALEWSKIAVNFTPGDLQLRRQHERFRSAPLPKR